MSAIESTNYFLSDTTIAPNFLLSDEMPCVDTAVGQTIP